MLNGVNLNYVVVLLVTGCVLMAAIYHTILYIHRSTILLSSYSAYLWASALYCGFRTIYFPVPESIFAYWDPDEVFQMIAFILYIRFGAIAWDLHPQRDKYAFIFARLTPYIVSACLVANTVFIHRSDIGYTMAKILVRVYLLMVGFSMVIVVLKKRQSPFFGYLAAGAISMIVFGIISSVCNLLFPPEAFALGALSWLMFGLFTDVVFFSAAIGYRIRQEHEERERSLKSLMQKEAELQQKELEKIKAIYEAREEERSRIAHDLHDEVGATLSGIALYSQISKKQLQAQKKEEAEQSLNRIQQWATEMTFKISDIVWALNPSKDSIQELCQKLEDYAREMGAAKNIEVQSRFTTPETEIRFSMQERRNIYLLLKEAINNAVKYSNCTLLDVSVTDNDHQLVFAISDNGKGFNPDTVQRGNGLSFMNHRAKDLNAEFMVGSVVNKGTTVQLILKAPEF